MIEDESYRDEELNENGQEEMGSNYNYIEKSQRKVYIEKGQFSIYESYRRFMRKEIILRPSYQRLDVWTPKKKSRLIESVLLNIPIPIFYFAELEDEKKEVVDGQQRFTAFFEFLNEEDGFPLENLEFLHELSGKTFKDLSSMFQRKIEDYQLTFFLIKKESHPDIRFDIFLRVNEGATKLNAQELRNAMYRGERISFLKELSQDISFKKMVEKKLAVKRLKDQETVLRFLAFYLNGYEAYNGNLNSFLNNSLKQLDETKDLSFEKLKTVFCTTMETIYHVFGEDAFIKGDSQKKKINLSLFDVLGYSFTKYEREKILKAQDLIRTSLNELTDKNTEFFNVISSNTLTQSNVRRRFEIWFNVMEECIGKVK